MFEHLARRLRRVVTRDTRDRLAFHDVVGSAVVLHMIEGHLPQLSVLAENDDIRDRLLVRFLRVGDRRRLPREKEDGSYKSERGHARLNSSSFHICLLLPSRLIICPSRLEVCVMHHTKKPGVAPGSRDSCDL